MEEFTEEERERLKKFAQDMNAWGRVGGTIRGALLWAGGGIAAYIIIWENILKHIFTRG